MHLTDAATAQPAIFTWRRRRIPSVTPVFRIVRKLHTSQRTRYFNRLQPGWRSRRDLVGREHGSTAPDRILEPAIAGIDGRTCAPRDGCGAARRRRSARPGRGSAAASRGIMRADPGAYELERCRRRAQVAQHWTPARYIRTIVALHRRYRCGVADGASMSTWNYTGNRTCSRCCKCERHVLGRESLLTCVVRGAIEFPVRGSPPHSGPRLSRRDMRAR